MSLRAILGGHEASEYPSGLRMSEPSKREEERLYGTFELTEVRWWDTSSSAVGDALVGRKPEGESYFD